MFFLQTLGKKINKVLESKEDCLLRTNDLNEIKNYLNNDALFKLYVLIEETLKSEKWTNIQTKEWRDSVHEARIETDGAFYQLDFNSEGYSVRNSKTGYRIHFESTTSFFQKYLNNVHKEIQRKEEERFI